MSVSTESRFKDSFSVRSLTLLKTKFVCSSPQSGSLKVQAALGYMFKLQGAVRQEERKGEGRGSEGPLRLAMRAILGGSMRKSQSRVLSEACREHRKYDNIVNTMPSFGQPGCPLTRQFLLYPTR